MYQFLVMKGKISKAVEEVKKLISETGDSGEQNYFEFHERRFLRMAGTITRYVPAGSRVLDIGSHYLHSAMILSKLGYEVTPIDVKEFWEISRVKKRAEDFRLQPVVCNDLEHLDISLFEEQKYDVILFTEILEHITFNPLDFWKKVYVLSRDTGVVYISTPNAFSLLGVVRALKNLVAFKSLGIQVNEIFDKVTYGHHWKEYSASEIKCYFHLMSDAFQVHVNRYSYFKADRSSKKMQLLSLIIALGNLFRVTASDLEAIVKVNKDNHKGWKIEPPAY